MRARAPEAYFRQYSYSDYFKGNQQALDHLQGFTEWFDDSPLLTVAYYLIGVNSKSFEEAKIAFDRAIKAFHLSLKEGKIPDKAYVYFRYASMLELAIAYITHYTAESDLETSQQLLNTIVGDFLEENHPFTSLLKENKPYPSLFEESEYALVQCYFKQGKEYLAQEKLSQMLTHYGGGGIQEGYYLSHVWCEQGKLAFRCEDYETARQCFEIVEECGEGFLPDDQRLSLWIFESDCYREERELDTAIRLLSKVINADIVSVCRSKALYQRAEIYELQGRPELAIRQLEAISKKEGEWAYQAQEKLRQDYGME